MRSVRNESGREKDIRSEGREAEAEEECTECEGREFGLVVGGQDLEGLGEDDMMSKGCRDGRTLMATS